MRDATRVGPKLHIIPLTLKEANDCVARWHRHHKPTVGHRFSIGVQGEDGELHGAAIIGRPVARMIEQWLTAEVLRCVTDGTPNACSSLYSAAWRAWRAMGGQRIITYTLASESGASLLATGWKILYQTKEAKDGWNVPSRPRPNSSGLWEQKTLWEMKV
jgi:hypothetical protein